MNRFELLLPRHADEAVKALAGGGVAKAAGIDLLDRMKEGIARPDRIVSLAALRGDGDPVETGSNIGRISAFATLSEVAGHEGIREMFPALAHAAGEAATPQIRNRATVGGNLLQEPRCWYYRLSDFDCLRKDGDGCPAKDGENQYHAILGYGKCPVVHPSNLAPALVALRAKAFVRGLNTTIPVEELWPRTPDPAPFHSLEPDQVLLSLRIPPSGPNGYAEIRHKQSFDWPLASAAVAKEPDGPWRVVLGCVAPVPWRSAGAEEALGREAKPDADRIERAVEAAVRGAKPLSKNAYKLQLARVAVKRALAEAIGGGR
jgi:xanthine dehydrogenase YagS FAD-binding subunit